MSPAPDEPGTPHGPTIEGLFGFGTDTWTARLQSAHQSPAPSRLGPYEVLGELGRGGQGEVYRAVQPGTGRIVAIKRISGLGLSPEPGLLVRFTREVEALTRLSHPNVVTVHTVDVVDSHTILVMELVEGRTIDQWADAQWAAAPEPLKVVLLAYAKACDGVAHAHQRGVIHRDIKPNNILVTSDGQPKVLDFGIARLLNEQAAAGAAPAWTMTGFAGTPAYASPEQLSPRKGGGVDTRSDVYSLGVLLFRVLTGEEAFDPALGLSARVKSADGGPVRAPSRVRPRLPVECDWIVRKATDPDPDRRYATVDALADDVRRLLDGRAVLAHAPSAWYIASRVVRRHPRISAGIAAAVVSVSTLGIVTAVQAARLSVRSAKLTEALADVTAQRTRAEEGERRQKSLNRLVLEAVVGTTEDTRMFGRVDPSPVQALTSISKQLTAEDDPDTVVEVHLRLGIALVTGGRRDEAETHFVVAQDVSDRIDDPGGERAIRIASRRAHAFRLSGKYAEALAVIERAIQRGKASARTVHIASLYWERLMNLHELKRPTDEVIASGREFIAVCDSFSGQPYWRVGAREETTYIMLRREQASIAETLMREALQIASLSRIDARKVSTLRFLLACAIARRCDWNEVEPLSRAASDYRVSTESASTARSHQYLRLHAVSLHGLGRFREALPRWELAMVRPLSRGKPADTELALVRTGMAAAHFGVERADAARACLALAISRGRTDQPEDPAVAADLARAESALRANAWVIDHRLRASLGDLKWLVDGLVFWPDPPASSTEESN